MKFLKTIIISLFLFNAISVFGQTEQNSLKSLRILFDKLYFAEDDKKKDDVNKNILKEFEEYLNESTFTPLGLESIKNLYVTLSKDDNVMIFTWAIPYSDFTTKYYGFIRYYSKDQRKYYVDKLNENKNSELNENENFSIDNWYGAVYYEIITMKVKSEKQYILLGWDANNSFTNKKIIDIVVFEEGEYPVFGKNVFETDHGLKKRIIFEYAERVSMKLNYDNKNKMILWDHLSPSKPELEGHYEYYGPDMTFDAYTFENGIWKLIKDVQLN